MSAAAGAISPSYLINEGLRLGSMDVYFLDTRDLWFNIIINYIGMHLIVAGSGINKCLIVCKCTELRTTVRAGYLSTVGVWQQKQQCVEDWSIGQGCQVRPDAQKVTIATRSFLYCVSTK